MKTEEKKFTDYPLYSRMELTVVSVEEHGTIEGGSEAKVLVKMRRGRRYVEKGFSNDYGELHLAMLVSDAIWFPVGSSVHIEVRTEK